MSIFSLPEDILGKINPVDLPPITNFNFVVQVDGMLPGQSIVAGFKSISGLTQKIRQTQIRSMGYSYPIKINNGIESSPVTLTRGLTLSRFLSDWWNDTKSWQRGQPDYHRNVTIISLANFKPDIKFQAWTWQLIKAYPVSWDAPELDVDNEQIAIESLTLDCMNIKTVESVFDGLTGEIQSLLNV